MTPGYQIPITKSQDIGARNFEPLQLLPEQVQERELQMKEHRMKKRIFYIVDVFAERKYAGNQLAIFGDAKDVPDSEMQQIAREMNYSETTFLLSEKEKDGGYDVRIFTPYREVPFAGHPTLGTAFVIQKEIIKEKVQEIILNLKVGQIPVTFNYIDEHPDILWMKQKPPTFGQTFEIEEISRILNLRNEDIDHRFPIQEVSTGLPFIIVPLKFKKALEKAKLTAEDKSTLVFCPETYNQGNDLNVRVFANSYGVPEDPATGSGNGCLAGYLVKHRFFGKDKIDIKVEQGYKIGRPSLLYLKAADKKSEIEVNVGGKVVMVARGEFI
jgi:trans-2,3-dihydro-3-hydroxyanthranilate isomerase